MISQKGIHLNNKIMLQALEDGEDFAVDDDSGITDGVGGGGGGGGGGEKERALAARLIQHISFHKHGFLRSWRL